MREDTPVISKRIQSLERPRPHLHLPGNRLVLKVLHPPRPALPRQSLRRNYLRLKVDHRFLSPGLEERGKVDHHLDQAVEQRPAENGLGDQRLRARDLVVTITGQNHAVRHPLTQEVGRTGLRHRVIAGGTDSVRDETLMRDVKGVGKEQKVELICLRHLVVAGNQEATLEADPRRTFRFSRQTGLVVKVRVLTSGHERLLSARKVARLQSRTLRKIRAQKHAVNHLQITPPRHRTIIREEKLLAI